MAVTQTPEMREKTLATAIDKLSARLVGFDITQAERLQHLDSDNRIFHEIRFSDRDAELFNSASEKLAEKGIHFSIHLLQATHVELSQFLDGDERAVVEQFIQGFFGDNTTLGMGIYSTNLDVDERFVMDWDSLPLSYRGVSDADQLKRILAIDLVTKADISSSKKLDADELARIKLLLESDDHKFLLEMTEQFREMAYEADYLGVMKDFVESDLGSQLIDAWNNPTDYVKPRIEKKFKADRELDIKDEITRIAKVSDQSIRLRLDLIRSRRPAMELSLVPNGGGPKDPEAG